MRTSLMRAIAASAVATVALAACGGPVEGGPEAETIATLATETTDPKIAAELARDKEEMAKVASEKPAFDAALAANDTEALEKLADEGNAWALFHRGIARLDSHDFMLQQGGFEDLEAAADHGLPEALIWVGQRKAYGKEGYKLQPNSGLIMMERAARRGNIEAMLAVAVMYEQDAYMHDQKKARVWYQRAAEAGSPPAKDALARLDGEAAGEGELPYEP
ncbi:MAG: hypothetical protein R3C46_08425 [Hyphomonadaceae bacterium]